MHEGRINVNVRPTVLVVMMVVMMVMLSLVTLLVLEQILLDLGILNFILGFVLVMAVAMVMAMTVAVIVTVTVTVTVAVIVRVSVLVVMVSVIVVVLMLSAQVVVSVARVQDFHLDEVEYEAHDRDDEHDVPLDLRWHPEAHGRLPEEPPGHDPDGRDGHQRSNDLRPMPAERQVLVRRLLCHGQSQNGNAETNQVTGQMRRVCENCDRTGHIAPNELRCNENRRHERNRDKLLLCRFIALLLHLQALLEIYRRFNRHWCAKDVKLLSRLGSLHSVVASQVFVGRAIRVRGRHLVYII